jgi:hypothetical protein
MVSRNVGSAVMDDDFAECSLAELVEDPVIGLMMKSDGVDRRSVELLFERLSRSRARLREGRLPRETAPWPAC